MQFEESPTYKNLISHIDLNRSIGSIDYFNFNDMDKEPKFMEFSNDINQDNDTIELSLIKNKVYKEAVIMSLNIINAEKGFLKKIIKDEQKRLHEIFEKGINTFKTIQWTVSYKKP